VSRSNHSLRIKTAINAGGSLSVSLRANSPSTNI
jgi:hypothetical protein